MFSPYEYFQYWRNVADADVEKFLMLFTFLPAEEVRDLGKLKDKEINHAKEVLAYEQTKLIHGEEEAEKAKTAARSAFSVAGGAVMDKSAIPSVEINKEDLEKGINVMELFAMTDLCSTKSEARRLVTQGGASINGKKITGINTLVDPAFEKDGELLLKAGKKRYFRIIIK